MIQTGKELAEACKSIARNEKTLYIMGCFGAPMTEKNKARYTTNDAYNARPDRSTKIKATDAQTFGFDCVGLIKGLLWGWNGETPSYYGGADYAAHGVQDIDANRMLDLCEDISTDFSNIQPGEALGMKDHIGVYIGGGLAVESTPRWEDGVQITAVHNMGQINGFNGRTWTRHGKLPWIAYNNTPDSKPAEPKEEKEMVYTKDDFIRDIQNVTGSCVDGVAGTQTLENTPTLSSLRNQHHQAVLPCQKRLASLGYSVGPKGDSRDFDGVTGVWFSEAVKAFQRDEGLMAQPDGELTGGHNSWKRLLEV